MKEVSVAMDTEISTELKREGLMRELIRHIQSSRKKAALQVDDRIELELHTEGELYAAANYYRQLIAEETLASDYKVSQKIEDSESSSDSEETLQESQIFKVQVTIEGQKLHIQLRKKG
jgi:isoleucyl-tRNA synthetase